MRPVKLASWRESHLLCPPLPTLYQGSFAVLLQADVHAAVGDVPAAIVQRISQTSKALSDQKLEILPVHASDRFELTLCLAQATQVQLPEESECPERNEQDDEKGGPLDQPVREPTPGRISCCYFIPLAVAASRTRKT
jgi:hypothetical protein